MNAMPFSVLRPSSPSLAARLIRAVVKGGHRRGPSPLVLRRAAGRAKVRHLSRLRVAKAAEGPEVGAAISILMARSAREGIGLVAARLKGARPFQLPLGHARAKAIALLETTYMRHGPSDPDTICELPLQQRNPLRIGAGKTIGTVILTRKTVVSPVANASKCAIEPLSRPSLTETTDATAAKPTATRLSSIRGVRPRANGRLGPTVWRNGLPAPIWPSRPPSPRSAITIQTDTVRLRFTGITSRQTLAAAPLLSITFRIFAVVGRTAAHANDVDSVNKCANERSRAGNVAL